MATLLQDVDQGQRGAVRVMRYEITYLDAPAVAAAVTFDFDSLLAGAIIRAIHVHVTEVFDSGASDGLEIGTVADPNAYGTTVDMQALSNAPPTGGANAAPEQLAADTPIRLTYTPAGAVPTQGALQVTITYENCNA